MKKTVKCLLGCLVIVAVVLVSGMKVTGAAENTSEETQILIDTKVKNSLESDDINTISVSVYPYLPDVELWCELLTSMWAEMEPEIELELREWDVYADSNPQGFDVLMYDALFTTYLIENGYIQSIEEGDVYEMDGIIPAAFEGILYGEKLYGIPNLMCSYFLIHWKDDKQIAQVDNFAELHEVLSERKENGAHDKRDGLLSNFWTDWLYYYLDTLADLNGKPDISGEILSYDKPDPVAIAEIDLIWDMQADVEDLVDPELGLYGRAVLFRDGYGSALYGYSETMAYMNDIVDQLVIRPISHGDGEDLPIYFADVVSLSADVEDSAKKEKCIKLMNLMCSEEFITSLSLGTGEAQYLLPVRDGVYDTVQQVFPIYERLYELVSDEKNHVMRYDEHIYEYIANAGEAWFSEEEM